MTVYANAIAIAMTRSKNVALTISLDTQEQVFARGHVDEAIDQLHHGHLLSLRRARSLPTLIRKRQQ
jgi:hypothetical protein